MQNKKYKIFNIIDTKLKKTCLIEASAGTGKTFTISLLYLRILLGINSKKYNVSQILVVTFNKFAQQELFSRIKNNISHLKKYCITKKINQKSNLKKIFDKIINFSQAYDILNHAENNLITAPIYTIDSFFQKILSFNIFKFNLINQKTIITDEENIYLEATISYWRKYFYSISIQTTYIIYHMFYNPKNLLKKIYPYLNDKINTKYKNKNFDNINDMCKNFYKKIKKIKKYWLCEEYNIFYKIQNNFLNKKRYTKKNLLKWIKNISVWAKSDNNIEKYSIPNELKYFQNNILNLKNITYKNKIFQKIEKIFILFSKIKKIIYSYSIFYIKKEIKKIKKKNNYINFNEISKKILFYIKKYKYSIKILKIYPISFIDEFQDINNNQFKIFYEIYCKNYAPIILIGDPKQAIYSFRNANILNYLNIKNQIKVYYSLITNWRCSKKINDGINFLFNKIKNPFILKKISFIPTKSPEKNKNIVFYIKKKKYSGLKFIYQKKKQNIKEFQEWISEKCAKNISYLIKYINKNQAFIQNNDVLRKIKYNDIVILVRNKIEAKIIKNKLNEFNISAIYLSKKNNIYNSKEAYEIFLILQALININNIQYIKKACFTNIFSISFNKIFQLSNNLNEFSNIIKKFKKYYDIWKNCGILNLIQMILINHENIININTENFIYLGELLQKKSVEFIHYTDIVNWLKKKIYQKDILQKNKICLMNQEKNIQIISIHQAKGLEYSIVWIPFGIYPKLNIIKKKNICKNNLSEEIRLLYVAFTRAIISCNIGITILKNKKNNFTNINNTAIGYIIQNGKKMLDQEFNQEIQKIKKKNIIQVSSKIKENKYLENKYSNFILYQNHKNIKKKKSIYSIKYNTNFSHLKIIFDNKNKNFEKEYILSSKNQKNIMNIHSFPKGKEYGILLHNILKKINFSNDININIIYFYLKKKNISKKWIPIIQKWLINIFNTPLKKKSNMKLINICQHQYIKELKFSIPIKKKITKKKIQIFIKNHNLSTKKDYHINFKNIDGMLNGTIDLIFFWKEKYYLIDYKSNWLGKNNDYYTNKIIKKEIIQKKYFLQYQIYSLALHKYLKKKIKNYSFSKNFGGIFYIFLRGIEKKKNNGIFFYLPQKSFINSLNNLIN